MTHLLLRKYFKPAEVRQENPALSTLPWPAQPVGPAAHAINKATEKEQLELSGKQKWQNKWEMIFSLIGYSVGLSSIWRFPYYAYRNGGGAFLIPYMLFYVILALPISYLEIALGQFSSLTSIKVWRLAPLFKGIGYAGLVVSALRMIYYNVVIAWAVYYLFASFTSELPWVSCGNSWNTARCRTTDGTGGPGITGPSYMSSADEFWKNRILGQSSGIEDSGTLRWEILLCLILVWLIVFLAIFRGIRSMGKLVYVTAIFPFLALLVLLVRSFMLPGAWNGIQYFLSPDLSALSNPMAWGDALAYVCYSSGIASGPFINLGSYNRFHNNCQKDSFILLAASVVTDLLSGLTVFAIIGFMSHQLGIGLESVITTGPGVAFVSYSTGVGMMPMAPIWGVIFFLMMFTLGIDSAFATMQAIVTVLLEEFKFKSERRPLMAAACCGVLGLASINLTTQSGIYWVNLMDIHVGRYPLPIIVFLEVIVVMYLYGYTRFADDLYVMLGFYPSWFWVILWNFVTPVTILGLLIGLIATHSATFFDGKYDYPDWAELLGWLMAGASLILIPIAMVAASYSHCHKETWKFRDLWRSKAKWGPMLEVHRELRYKPSQNAGEDYDFLESVSQAGRPPCDANNNPPRRRRRFRFSIPRLNFRRRNQPPSYHTQPSEEPEVPNDIFSCGSAPPAYPGGPHMYPDLDNTRFSGTDSISISNPDMFQHHHHGINMPDNARPQIILPPNFPPQPAQPQPVAPPPENTIINNQANAVSGNQAGVPINLHITLVQGNQQIDQGQGQGQCTTQVMANQEPQNTIANQAQFNIPTTNQIQVPQVQYNQPLAYSTNQCPPSQPQQVTYSQAQTDRVVSIPSNFRAPPVIVGNQEQFTNHHVHLPETSQNMVFMSPTTGQAPSSSPVMHTSHAVTRPTVPPIDLGPSLAGLGSRSALGGIRGSPTFLHQAGFSPRFSYM